MKRNLEEIVSFGERFQNRSVAVPKDRLSLEGGACLHREGPRIVNGRRRWQPILDANLSTTKLRQEIRRRTRRLVHLSVAPFTAASCHLLQNAKGLLC